MILRFIWHALTRFAKTFGCIFFIAGFALATFFHHQRQPLIEAAKYRPSDLLQERLSALGAQYNETKQLLLRAKAQPDFPDQFAGARVTPQFAAVYGDSKSFPSLRTELSQIGQGRDAMKAYVIATVDGIVSDLRAKLLAHAQSVRETSSPSPNTSPTQAPNANTIFGKNIDPSNLAARKASLDSVNTFFSNLNRSVENPENKTKIETAISEIQTLTKLLPETAAVSAPLATPSSSEPLVAEKVIDSLSEVRNRIRGAVLWQWTLDDAFDRALKTAEDEQGKSLSAEASVRQIGEELHLLMAAAITGGFVLGLFFLLVGDWTARAKTELLVPVWRQLIENCSASPKEVYDLIEQCVTSREIPGLETKRELWHEGGALSSKREYLRFARERLNFEICAAPFGTGFFLSFRSTMIPLVIDPLAIFAVLIVAGIALLAFAKWFGLLWGAIILVLTLCVLVFALRSSIARGVADMDRVFMKMPLFAPLYEIFLRPLTYFRIDNTYMYVDAMRQAVNEALEKMFGDKGVSLTLDAVSKPATEEIYQGWK